MPINSWLRWLGWSCKVQFAPYNQVFQQLLDPNSLFSGNSAGTNVVLLNVADWAANGDDSKLRETTDQFQSALLQFQLRATGRLVVIICPPPPTDNPRIQQSIFEAQQSLAAQLTECAGIELIEWPQIEKHYPVESLFDSAAARAGHVTYTQLGYIAVASELVRRLHRQQQPIYKAVVLDCDQTLWDGVCGEDGPQGVTIPPARRHLQQRIRELRQSGLLVCLCSKNEPDDVRNVFANNNEMLLTWEEVTASRVNWLPKSENLRSLAQQLNLGLDSFIFVDDNPLECAEVRANCPEVLTLQLPQDQLIEFVDHVWAWDVGAVSDQDRKRADQYVVEQHRQAARQQSATYEEFLANLELKVDLRSVTDADLERASQLTQRTNQFNFTTIRRSAAELRELLAAGRLNCLVCSVQDRFGDYGQVGFLAYTIGTDALIVDSLMLSCRALGRRVEHAMLIRLAEFAQAAGRSVIEFTFHRTEKNAPALEFYRTVIACGAGSQVNATTRIAVQQLLQNLQNSHAMAPIVADDRTADSTASPTRPSTGEALINWIANELNSVSKISAKIAAESRPRPELETDYVGPKSQLQKSIAQYCSDVMHIDRVGLQDSLKALGITSLQVVQIYSRIVSDHNVQLSITDLFTLPTVAAIAERVESLQDERSAATSATAKAPCVQLATHAHRLPRESIAIVGMAGRFPGADNVDQFWSNLVNGVCSIVDIPEQDLNLPANSPLRQNPNLVRRSAAIADPEMFDARFFGVFPKEAQVMDPQHRIMIECCWHALEDAGYIPDSLKESVGLFAGCYMDTYILASLAGNPKLLESLANSFHGGDLHTELGNDKDYLVTRVAYLLNLRGPAMTVQTACSTSLVAIAQACQSLLAGQCDMALAGGVTLKLPQNRGYLYTEGGMVSPDGYVRTFDAQARGTVFGEGAGIVVLKRLDDAIADGNDIYAVLRGWGLNNDGRAKLGYTAPSVVGQTAAIELAHQMAGISAETISYVEAHGTGTSLGDPIEIDALTRAFRRTTNEKQFCAIGSLKTNIGHLDVAAGVSGLMKICLSMHHEVIPPSLHFLTPNPNIDFPNSPFIVNTALRPWARSTAVRRAGLSSFGVGGTNAHVVVEEPPLVSTIPSRRKNHLITLAARSATALNAMSSALADRLEQRPSVDLADVAYTLQTGRKTFNYTRTIVGNSATEIAHQLRSFADDKQSVRHQIRRDVPAIWIFPGQGSQYPNMGAELYRSEPVFTAAFDQCAEILRRHAQLDIEQFIFAGDQPATALNQTRIAQPAIFSIAYAYAQLLLASGVQPECMIGHSVGEFIAATVGGVFSLEDALRMIAYRAELMQSQPTGSMLAVKLTESELQELLCQIDLRNSVAIAAVNGPEMLVASGPTGDIERIESTLNDRDIPCRRLHTSHAFHSSMMNAVVDPFREALSKIELRPSSIPIISSVTGQRLTDQQACDANYWAGHLRETVRFSDAIGAALATSPAIMLEVGPGQTVATLAKQHPACDSAHTILSLSPHAKQPVSDAAQFWVTLGRIWQAGINVNFQGLYASEQRRRLHLPGYPFERQRYWFDQIVVESESEERADLQESVSCSAPPTDTSKSSESSQIESPPAQTSMPTETTAVDAEDEMIQSVIKQQLALMAEQLHSWTNQQ